MVKGKGKQICMILALVGLLVGCGSQNNVPDDYATNEGYQTEKAEAKADTETAASESDNTATTGIAREDIKVGVLYISDPGEGSGYSYTHDLGIQGMQENLGLSSDQIVRKIVDDSDTQATEASIRECIDEGCNIIFTTSWGYMETTAAMAEEYPDIYFSHGTGYMSNGKNFNNYFGRIYQARYLSGIVAGMNTKSNQIGYVAAQDSSNSEVTGGIDAFAIGVASVNPDAKINVIVTNSWYDPAKEEAASRQLLDMGCDVMAQHCDTAYPQTLAQERGVYGIGYNSDMSKETPDSCLTSVIWNWSAYYTSAVKSIIDGSWDGSNYYGGMAEGLVGITNLASFAAEGTQEKVDEATAAILSGQNNVFDDVMTTNTGETVGQEGSTLDDATITGGIDWYYQNVVIIE
ncbi:BMP family ABC transporter substrate-binding protein [Kineothrix sp. MSJ-39]|uniref:BMP family ABC transporter substrate-binding protein n=1 Tax=Kineothrix sp. MSJ-39 TaxID=2841533 RepID=UPI0020A229D9|nr:BMP family ABC transporter substrate-binding protein [Kineothrix sp. MSJ-39]